MTWVRPNKFPEDKYQFAKYLTRVGDFVTTQPMTKREAFLWKDALYKWAYYHFYRVSTRLCREAGGLWSVTGTLVAKHPVRDFD